MDHLDIAAVRSVGTTWLLRTKHTVAGPFIVRALTLILVDQGIAIVATRRWRLYVALCYIDAIVGEGGRSEVVDARLR